jgi:hypothetical protein
LSKLTLMHKLRMPSLQNMGKLVAFNFWQKWPMDIWTPIAIFITSINRKGILFVLGKNRCLLHRTNWYK